MIGSRSKGGRAGQRGPAGKRGNDLPPRGSTVSLDRLDAWLDVPERRYAARLVELAEFFHDRDLRLGVPTESPLDHRPAGAAVSWVNLYAAQVARLPRMDRAEEFRMARRYEFCKSRVWLALERAGYAPEQVDALVLESPDDLPAAADRRKATVSRRAKLRRAMNELWELRNRYVEGALYIVMAGVQRFRGLGVDTADLIQEANASLFQAIEGFDWRRDVRFKTYAQYWVHQAVLKLMYNTSRTVRVPVWVQKALKKILRLQEAGRLETGFETASEVIAEQLDMPSSRVDELLATRRRSISLDAELGSGEDAGTLSQMLPDERQPPVPETVHDEGDLGTRLAEVMADLPERERLILTRRYGLDGREPETLGEIAVDLGVTAERVRQLQKAAIGRLQKPRKIDRLEAFS